MNISSADSVEFDKQDYYYTKGIFSWKMSIDQTTAAG